MVSVVRRVRRPVAGQGRATLPCIGIALTAVLAGAAGCTDTTRPRVDRLPSLGRSLGRSLGPATSTGPVRPDPNFEPPDTAAGAELLTTFPAPSDLGPGWAYADADAGGPGLERDVDDIVDGSVPRDCLRLNPMPLPQGAARSATRSRGHR